MDFFHHEMLKASLLCCFCIPLDFRGLLLDLVTVQVIEVSLARSQLCKLKVADVIDITGILQNGRNIRCHIGFPVSNADDHRAILSCHPDLVRIVTEHQLKGIGTTDTHHRFGDSIDGTQIILFIIVIHQLDDYFGVRLAIEGIAMFQQLFFQLCIILDDTVMNANHFRLYCTGAGTAAIARNVRMCIGLARLTMCCPASMTNTTSSFQSIACIRFLNQVGQTAFCLDDLRQILSVTDSQSGRIISSIFQF